ncbi:MAG: hypothetical protein HYW48_09495 [Deltaproteobacteria bacterium]|nr:hypothetical protein [Deltaproteobacteria bacterium]
MIALTISIVLLLVAPFVYRALLEMKKFWGAMQKLVNILISALVVLHLLPESIAQIGWPALGLAFFGLFLPGLLERAWKRGAETVHLTSVGVGLIGLLLHGAMDGVALATPASMGNSLPLAVILHRLPDGMLICAFFADRRYLSYLVLALLGISTLGGFMAGGRFFQEHAGVLAYFQALVAGSFLHITFDYHDPSVH